MRAQQASGEKSRRFKELNDGSASRDHVERITSRIKAGPLAVNTRIVVTSLKAGSPRTLYEEIYCARGRAEKRIKAWETHLAAGRTSCSRASANQMRLYLHIGAFRLNGSLRSLRPRRSLWHNIKFDTLRLRLIRLAVRLETLKRSSPGRCLQLAFVSKLFKSIIDQVEVSR